MNSKGFLIAGKGGSGKSGLTIQAILRGLGSAGDDYVIVDARNRIASPVYRTLKQDRDGLDRLSLTTENLKSGHWNWKDKYQFEFADLRESARPEPHALHGVILPKIGSGKTRIRRAAPKEAFLTLAPSCVTQLPCNRDIAFAVAAQITQSLPAWSLELGPDADDVHHALLQLSEMA